MPSIFYRHILLAISLLSITFFSYNFLFGSTQESRLLFNGLHKARPAFRWKDVKLRYPPEKIQSLPSASAAAIPKIQFDFPPESSAERAEREQRLQAVKDTFVHSWKGYKDYAWLQDEVGPLSGKANNGFGGWGATLIDSLDTLWIMGMKKEFNQAVKGLDYIDFSRCPNERINVFETTIRYLGGLLSAYDLSGRKYKKILKKAIEVGDMLYVTFDTPTRLPITQWYWEKASRGIEQDTPLTVLLAEYGSMSMEFTRLSQITGDPKYYDAIARIMDLFEAQQNDSNIPGLWPVSLKAKAQNFSSDSIFTFGALADSAYEYLPKQHLLLQGRSPSYKKMYEGALSAAKDALFFRSIHPDASDMLFSGGASGWTRDTLYSDAEMQHLTCFVGGMVALGAKMFSSKPDLDIARQLTNGCIWAYESMPSGIMPERFNLQRCGDGVRSQLAESTQRGVRYENREVDKDCEYTEAKWHYSLRAVDAHLDGPDTSIEEHAATVIEQRRLKPGYTRIVDPRYLLRPEAIESVFVLYRTTGDRELLDKGWKMFEAVRNHTRTEIAHAQVKDVTVNEVELEDKMESFWGGETLKYFYLLFSEPDVVSLDTFVLNTEAHPLLWRT